MSNCFVNLVQNLLGLRVLLVILVPKGIQRLVRVLIFSSKSQNRRDVRTSLDSFAFESAEKAARVGKVDCTACKRSVAFLNLLVSLLTTWN